MSAHLTGTKIIDNAATDSAFGSPQSYATKAA
jgi:hypothetical protein